uniref:EF-hand domain-containing protein n=1 Tax=Panagrolaimus sp. PS1159 TaxID=55785 RepID=A0AC35GR28_9BILA
MASVEQIRKIYDQHDDDGNGVLSFEEAEEAVKALGDLAKDPSNFASDFKRLAKDGVITFEEFKQFAKLA